MKTIKRPDLEGVATLLSPAEMNKIHFGGIHSALTPEQIKELANKADEQNKAKPGQN